MKFLTSCFNALRSLKLTVVFAAASLSSFAQSHSYLNDVYSTEGTMHFVASSPSAGACEEQDLLVLNTVSGQVNLSPSLCVKQQHVTNGNLSTEHVIWKKSYLGAEVELSTDGVVPDYNYIIKCTLSVTNAGNPSTIYVSVPLSYKNAPVETHNAKSVVYLGTYDEVSLTGFSVTDVDQNTMVSNFEKNFKMFVQMDEEIYRDGTPSVSGYAASQLSNKDIFLDWTPGNEPKPGWYQLEWKYVPNTTTLSSTAVGDVLADGATRIITKETDYTITNHFNETGNVYWRIRYVRPYYNSSANTVNTNVKAYSQWFSPANPCSVAVASITDDINYQYEVTYAEEGKRKESVMYYDGSGRQRQSLYRLEGNNDMVVGNTTFLNYNGDPAVTTLPGPVKLATGDKPLAFVPYLDAFSNSGSVYGGAYENAERNLYDRPDAYPGTLSSGNGAGKYYSGDNPWYNSGAPADEMDKYIPDAEGYPYVYTEYDGEGRPIYQSQPGPDGYVAVDGEGYPEKQFTLYEYAQPTAAELDMYLGNHAANPANYTKILQTDPNGQTTVTIQDLKGRTVMTYIVDEPASGSLHPIDTKPGPIYIFEDLIGESTDNERTATGWTFSKTISIDSRGGTACVIEYEMDAVPFSTCSPPQEDELCYQCKYDITFDLFDSKGNWLMSWTSDPFQMTETDIQALATCTGALTFDLSGVIDMEEDFNDENSNKISQVNVSTGAIEFFLKGGVYTIKKTLNVVSEEKVEKLAGDYLTKAEANGCLRDEFSFIDEFTVEEPYACTTAYSREPASPCTSMEEEMKQDVYPLQGKYADYSTTINTDDKFSIFKVLMNQVGYGSNLISTANSTFSGSPDFLTQFLVCDGSGCATGNCEMQTAKAGYSHSLEGEPEYCGAYASTMNGYINTSTWQSGNPFYSLLPSYPVHVSSIGSLAAYRDDVLSMADPLFTGAPVGYDFPDFVTSSSSSNEFVLWSAPASGLTAGQLYEFKLDLWNIATPSGFKKSKLKVYVGDDLIGQVTIYNDPYDASPAFTYTHSGSTTEEYVTITWDISYNGGTYPNNNGLFGFDNVVFRTKDMGCDCTEAFGLPNPTTLQAIYPYQCLYSVFAAANISVQGTNPSMLSINDFINAFDKSWLPYMIRIHPEYCNLILCELIHNPESAAFTEKLESYTWDEMVADADFTGFDIDPTDGLTGLYPFDPLFEDITYYENNVSASGLGLNTINALSSLQTLMEERLDDFLPEPYLTNIYESTVLTAFSSVALFEEQSGSYNPDLTTIHQYIDWVGTTGFADNNFSEAFWQMYKTFYLQVRSQVLMNYAQQCMECSALHNLILGKEPPTLLEQQQYLNEQFNTWLAGVMEDFSNSGTLNNASVQAQTINEFTTANTNFESECNFYLTNRIMEVFPIVYTGTTAYVDANLSGGTTADAGDVLVSDLAAALDDECACGATMAQKGTVELKDPIDPYGTTLWYSISSQAVNSSTSNAGIAHEFVNTLWNSGTYPGGSTAFNTSHESDPESLFLLDLNPYVLFVAKPFEALSVTNTGMQTSLPVGFNPAPLSPQHGNVVAAVENQPLSYGSGTTLQTSAGGSPVYLWNELTGNTLTPPVTVDVGSVTFDPFLIRNSMYQPSYPTAYHFFKCTGVDGNSNPVTLRGFYPAAPLFEMDEAYLKFDLGPTPVDERMYCSELTDLVVAFLEEPLIQTYTGANNTSLLNEPLYMPSMKGYIFETTSPRQYYPEVHIEEMIAGCEVYDNSTVASAVTIEDHLPLAEQMITQPFCATPEEEAPDPDCVACSLFYKALMEYEKGSATPDMDEADVGTALNGASYSNIASDLGLTLPGGFAINDWVFSYPKFTDRDNWNHFMALKEMPIKNYLVAFLNDELNDFAVPDPSVPYNTTVNYTGPSNQAHPHPSTFVAVSSYASGSLIYQLSTAPASDQVRFWMDNNSSGRIWFHLAYQGSDVFHDIFIDYDHLNGAYTLEDIDEIVDIVPYYGTGEAYEFYVVAEDVNDNKIYLRGTTTFPVAYVCEMPAISLYEQPSNSLPAWEKNCEEEKYYDAYREGREAYEQQIKGAKDAFVNDYIAHCVDNVEEHLWYGHDNAGYNYTLYLYDRADNLIATVPPQGVRPMVQLKAGGLGQLQYHTGAQAAIKSFRAGISDVFIDPFANNSYISTSGPYVKPHFMQTHYDYNTYNEVYRQNTPDGGESQFHYDNVGRIAFSQNAEQEVEHKFSYSLYDAQSRVEETGEFIPGGTVARIGSTSVFEVNRGTYTWQFDQSQISVDASIFGIFDPMTPSFDLAGADFAQIQTLFALLSENQWQLYVRDHARTHAVVTVYDTPPAQGWVDHSVGQEPNLRGRVSAMYKYDVLDGDGSDFDNGIVYHYDETGNVKRLYREIRDSGFEMFKVMEYKYDIISGKVVEFHYQPGQEDELIHRYEYDSDNRLTEVWTSREGVIWEQDATYEYYRHGPLKNQMLGHRALQHMEYAYNINGWLKLMNGMNDMGVAFNLTETPKDILAYELHYNTNDYTPLSAGYYTTSPTLGDYELYNGNIAGISMYQRLDNNFSKMKVGRQYQYDQLSRIKWMKEYNYGSNNDWQSLNDLSAYYEYDGNGNIQHLDRMAFTAGGMYSAQPMDNLGYSYKPENNQLLGYCETVSASLFEGDLDPSDASVTRYIYPLPASFIGSYDMELTTCGCFTYDNWPPPLEEQCATNSSSDLFNLFVPADGSSSFFDANVACKIETLAINVTYEGGGCSNPGARYFVVATVLNDEAYVYDNNGNLIEDLNEGIEVDWNPIGKIQNVNGSNTAYSTSILSSGGSFGQSLLVPTGFPDVYDGASLIGLATTTAYQAQVTTTRNMDFDYDPMGERIKKFAHTEQSVTYLYQNGTPGDLVLEDGVTFVPSEKARSEYYVRDAQGNVIAMYYRVAELNSATEYYDALLHNIQAYEGVAGANVYTDMVTPMMDRSWLLKQNVMLASGHDKYDVLDLLTHDDVFDEMPALMIDLMLANNAAHAQGFYEAKNTAVKNKIRTTATFIAYAEALGESQAYAEMDDEYQLFQAHEATLMSDILDAKAAWSQCLQVNACTDMQACETCEDYRINNPFDEVSYQNCLANAPCNTASCHNCDTEWQTYDELANLLTFESRLAALISQKVTDLLTGSAGLQDVHYEDVNGDLLPWVVDEMATTTFTNMADWRDYLDTYFALVDWQPEVLPLVADHDPFIEHFFMDFAADSWYTTAVGGATYKNDLSALASIMGRSDGKFHYEHSNDLFGSMYGNWALRWSLNDPGRAPGTSGLPYEPPYGGAVDFGELPQEPMQFLVYTMNPAEYYIYGSSRLGMIKHYDAVDGNTHKEETGDKQYEITDHLGNVRATISNRKLVKADIPASTFYYDVDIVSSTDYYPFGMPMQGRYVNLEPEVTAGFDVIEQRTTISKDVQFQDVPGDKGTSGQMQHDETPLTTANLDNFWVGKGAGPLPLSLEELYYGSTGVTSVTYTTTTGPGVLQMNGTNTQMMLMVPNGHSVVGVFHEIDPLDYDHLDAGDEITITADIGFHWALGNSGWLMLLDNNFNIVDQVPATTSGFPTSDHVSLTVDNLAAGIYYACVAFNVDPAVNNSGLATMLFVTNWKLTIRGEVSTQETYVNNNEFIYQPRYRYGFQGQEGDAEWMNIGQAQTIIPLYVVDHDFNAYSLGTWSNNYNSVISNTSGELKVDILSGISWSGCKRNITGLTPGQTYTISFDLDMDELEHDMIVRIWMSGGVYIQKIVGKSGRVSYTFTADQTNHLLVLLHNGMATYDQQFTIDNFDVNVWDGGFSDDIHWSDNFDNANKWTLEGGGTPCGSVVNGQLKLETITNTCGATSEEIVVESGMTYQVSVDLREDVNNLSNMQFRLEHYDYGSATWVLTAARFPNAQNAMETFTIVRTIPSDKIRFRVFSHNAATYPLLGYVDNIIVKRLGNFSTWEYASVKPNAVNDGGRFRLQNSANFGGANGNPISVVSGVQYTFSCDVEWALEQCTLRIMAQYYDGSTWLNISGGVQDYAYNANGQSVSFNITPPSNTMRIAILGFRTPENAPYDFEAYVDNIRLVETATPDIALDDFTTRDMEGWLSENSTVKAIEGHLRVDLPEGSSYGQAKRYLTAELQPNQTYTVSFDLEKYTVANTRLALWINGVLNDYVDVSASGHHTHTFTIPSNATTVLYRIVSLYTTASDQYFIVDNFKVSDGSQTIVESNTGYNYYTTFYRAYDARLGRWMSVDPLLFNFPWESTYCSMGGDPISRIDPLGGSYDNYLIKEDGGIEVERTTDKTDNFKYQSSDGTITDLGTFNKNDNGYIELPSSYDKNGISFKYTGSQNENYISGDAFAALLGALKSTGTTGLSLNHWSNSDGTSPHPSRSHKNGTVGDLRPLRTDKSGAKVLVSDSEFDKEANKVLITALKKYGWTSILSEEYDGYITPGTTHFSGYTDKNGKWVSVRHNNHFHIQKFKPQLKVVDKLSIMVVDQNNATPQQQRATGRSIQPSQKSWLDELFNSANWGNIDAWLMNPY